MINMDALRAGIIYQIGMEIWKERRKEASDILPSLTHSSKIETLISGLLHVVSEFRIS